MNTNIHRLCLGLLPALLLGAFAPQTHATPVFQPIKSFVYGPSNPRSKLLQASDGDLYGTTSGNDYNTYGTVFKMTPGGTLTNLVNFNNTNGRDPNGVLVQASDGNIYGTTMSGGTTDKGTVFKLSLGGKLTTLVNFGGTNGEHPRAGLYQASDGNLYGTTYGNYVGTTYGTVFKVTLGGKLTTLVSFNKTNGANPQAGLIQANDGNLY